MTQRNSLFLRWISKNRDMRQALVLNWHISTRPLDSAYMRVCEKSFYIVWTHSEVDDTLSGSHYHVRIFIASARIYVALWRCVCLTFFIIIYQHVFASQQRPWARSTTCTAQNHFFQLFREKQMRPLQAQCAVLQTGQDFQANCNWWSYSRKGQLSALSLQY